MVHINGKDIDAAGQSLAAYLKAKGWRYHRNCPVYGGWNVLPFEER